MNPRIAIFLLVASLALSACGNKGPLVLPDKPTESAAPADTAGPATETPPTTTETPPETPAERLPLEDDN